MFKPLIGVTCHAMDDVLPRSAMVQIYLDAIEDAGGCPVGIPLGLGTASLQRIFGALDGLLLPGGDDVAPHRYGQDAHPRLGAVDENRDELEITLAQWALRDDLPVLGICRGIQVLAVAAGGSLYQDLPSELASHLSHDVRQFGRDHLSHAVAVEVDTILCRAIGCTMSHVNSFHHQAVRDVPPGFIVSAKAEDGVVEAIEAPDMRFAIGVQCHPEGMWRTTAPIFRGLFTAFVAAAASRPERLSSTA